MALSTDPRTLYYIFHDAMKEKRPVDPTIIEGVLHHPSMIKDVTKSIVRYEAIALSLLLNEKTLYQAFFKELRSNQDGLEVIFCSARAALELSERYGVVLSQNTLHDLLLAMEQQDEDYKSNLHHWVWSGLMNEIIHRCKNDNNAQQSERNNGYWRLAAQAHRYMQEIIDRRSESDPTFFRSQGVAGKQLSPMLGLMLTKIVDTLKTPWAKAPWTQAFNHLSIMVDEGLNLNETLPNAHLNHVITILPYDTTKEQMKKLMDLGVDPLTLAEGGDQTVLDKWLSKKTPNDHGYEYFCRWQTAVLEQMLPPGSGGSIKKKM